MAAVLCATVANAFASRERKLRLVNPVTTPIQRIVTEAPDRPSTVPETATLEPVTVTSEPAQTASAQPATSRQPTTTQPPVRQPEPAAAKPSPRVFNPHPDTPWVEIDPAAVRELFDRGAPFVDARRTAVYEQGHIAGARNISVWESDLDDKLKAFYEEGLDPEAPVVVYCSGGNCEDSHTLGQRLWGLGFNNVLVYKDGYPDWLKQGGPTRTGSGR